MIVSIYMIHVTIRVAHDLRKSNHPLKCATTELSSSDQSMVLLDLLSFLGIKRMCFVYNNY